MVPQFVTICKGVSVNSHGRNVYASVTCAQLPDLSSRQTPLETIRS